MGIMNDELYNGETGLPIDEGYLECALPDFLRDSIEQMEQVWKKLDNGEKCLTWDGEYCTLQSDINCAEVDCQISSEQAWYLRKKYLRMREPEVIE